MSVLFSLEHSTMVCHLGNRKITTALIKVTNTISETSMHEVINFMATKFAPPDSLNGSLVHCILYFGAFRFLPWLPGEI